MDIKEKIKNAIEKQGADYEKLRDLYDMARLCEDKAERREWLLYVRRKCREVTSADAFELIRQTYVLGAQDGDFDDYCIALEWYRDPEKRFYLPRRSVLKPLVDDLQDLFDGRLEFLGVSLPPRVGKALALDTPVLTRTGWKEHGDLTIRDEVLAPNGEFVKVLAIHPVCDMEYEVTFTNGEKVVCHGNHEWNVYNRHKNREDKIETKQMVSDFTDGKRFYYQLPIVEPIIGEVKELPVKPYTLGVWLGDGRNTNPDVCGAEEDLKPIVDSVYADGYTFAWKTKHKTTGVYYFGFRGLREDLQKVGMCHSRRKVSKYIPETYLTASVEQRLELLAGLLDTDGTLSKKEHRYAFTTAEKSLCDSFVALVSTFGWRCSVTAYEPSISSSGIAGKRTYYQVGFNPTMYIPCRIERKQLWEFSKQRRIAVRDIRRIDGVKGNCITVEGGKYLVGNTLLPTHNSTLCIFFMTFVMGHRPSVASVMSGHSDKLTDGFYRELLSIITDDTQYRWHDVFPGVNLVDNSAKNETIDLERKKRFPTMTCRSISGTLTGAVEIGTGGILYCDDLIEDLEESLNPVRLQNKYDAYLNQLKDRKKLGALELMVGTRWNVADPLGRIEEQYRDNPKYRFRVIPALNEDGESNFNYKYDLGFDTDYYLDMKDSIDDATWMAKYMGNPYIREGLLFPAAELQYFNGVLPDGEPDRIAAVIDTAWGGGDSLSMPIAYVYGNDTYIADVVFNNGDKTVTRPLVIGKLKAHHPHMARWESNNGGDEYGGIVDEKLRQDGVKINMSYKKAPTNQSKLSRIIQHAPDIKRYYFLDEKHRSGEYEKFMRELTLFTVSGKNLHDDAADSLAMMEDFLSNGIKLATVAKRPF